MSEQSNSIQFLDKNFIFVEKTKEKIRYKYENHETGEISILEVLISNADQQIKKIDIYTFIEEEVLETLHIYKGNENDIELSYYPREYEQLTLGATKNLYQISVYQNYSEINEVIHLEDCQLELVKKGHKKHKLLERIPLDDNHFIGKNNKIYLITGRIIKKMQKIQTGLFSLLKDIENKSIMLEIQASQIVSRELGLLEQAVEKFPIKKYIYDRNYELAGVSGQAIVYRSTEDDFIEIELYLNDDQRSLKEIRVITYNKQKALTENIKSKKQIIRLVLKEDRMIYANLCSRRKESLLVNGHQLDKADIKADAIIDHEGKIIEMDLKITSNGSTFNLKNSSTIPRQLVDKNNNEYLVSSVTYNTYKMFISYVPYIVKNMEEILMNDAQQESSNIIYYKNYHLPKKEEGLI